MMTLKSREIKDPHYNNYITKVTATCQSRHCLSTSRSARNLSSYLRAGYFRKKNHYFHYAPFRQ